MAHVVVVRHTSKSLAGSFDLLLWKEVNDGSLLRGGHMTDWMALIFH